MFAKSVTLSALAALAAATMAAAPAQAQYYGNGGYYSQVRGYGHGDRHYNRHHREYDRRSYGRHRCRDNGTGGTIIGAIAGGLLGNSVAGRRDRTTGTILGAGVGALAGRAIDRDC